MQHNRLKWRGHGSKTCLMRCSGRLIPKAGFSRSLKETMQAEVTSTARVALCALVHVLKGTGDVVSMCLL
ncbi:hypothetical protein GOP47_0023594 [Adiantum capillus-veneris]|uniref:Uncharacterized protein n=1 Tax=Adiantum capillus-veneris TaxID=13818 RepID=A0A9D4Z4L5_ADICA|nr:hypothetical protein GOP47_0023594 [Adiantum capillus-veneris]